MDRVSVIRCEDYESSRVYDALSRAIAAIGGLDWVKAGMRIGIKANLVSHMKPETAATTHPEVLIALTKMLRERGAEVVVGDSPGGLFNSVFVNRVYAATGMRLVEEAGAKLNTNFGQTETDFPEAKVCRHFTYTAWLDDVDAIIDCCKLKTHGMMGMSAAVKNLFGTIPGTMKPEYHFRFPNETVFSEMLIDLNMYFKTKLSIADAIIGMEGNGPTMGKPRAIGAILASESPYALDLVGADMIGLTAKDVPTLAAATARGLCTDQVSEIEIVGDEMFRISDFDLILSHHSVQFEGSGGSKKLYGKTLGALLTSKPTPKKDMCVGCGLCNNICPAKAITMVNKIPVIDRKKCIRCFCCQEFCPKGAMVVKRPFIASLLSGKTNKKK